MNFRSLLPRLLWLVVTSFALLQSGCATTPKVDWSGRVGHYTYDQAVLEMGPPDKAAELSDGTRVVRWIIRRGGSRTSGSWLPGAWIYSDETTTVPDEVLTATFGPDGILKDFKRSSR